MNVKAENSRKPVVTIEWNTLELPAWQEFYNRIPKSNLIQTYHYARAMRMARKQMSRFGLVHVDGRPKGLVQIQEIRLLGFFHWVFLDRGPLWFEPVSEEETESFFTAFNSLFPRRWGRRRRVMPEIPRADENRQMMERCGFAWKTEGYKSLWLDLRRDEEALREGLSSSWRNKIGKAERAEVRVKNDELGTQLEWLFGVYHADRMERRYRGPAVPLLRWLCKYAGEDDSFLHLIATLRGDPVASVLIFTHGTSATYQIGWTSEKGKKNAAHNLLLWQAMIALKSRGVQWFDLGGINDDAAEGLTKFKRATGGEEFELSGIYA